MLQVRHTPGLSLRCSVSVFPRRGPPDPCPKKVLMADQVELCAALLLGWKLTGESTWIKAAMTPKECGVPASRSSFESSVPDAGHDPRSPEASLQESVVRSTWTTGIWALGSRKCLRKPKALLPGIVRGSSLWTPGTDGKTWPDRRSRTLWRWCPWRQWSHAAWRPRHRSGSW